MTATTIETKALPAGLTAAQGEDGISIEVAVGEATLHYRAVRNRGEGGSGGAGWIEETVGGRGHGARRRVSAAEAYAVAASVGAEELVAAATERLLAELLAAGSRGAGQAARLRAELADGRAGERVAVGPLRSRVGRVLEAGVSLSTLAREAGIRTPGGAGDVSALQRRLGLEPHGQRSGRQTWSQTVAYEEAVAIARAVGADPFEVGV